MIQPREWPSATGLEPTWQRLAELAALPHDWDSYGADPPTARAIALAVEVVRAVAERVRGTGTSQVAPSFIAPVPDGGVQLEWEVAAGDLEVVVGPEGGLGYLWAGTADEAQSEEEQTDVPWSALIERITRTLSLEL